MTTDLLIALGKANLAAAAAIVAVIAVRKLVRRAFGAKLAYALWLAVPLAAAAVLLPARTIVETLTPVLDPGPVVALTTPTAQVAEPAAPAPPQLDLGMIAAWLWVAGALVTAVWLMRKQAAFMADERVGKAGPAVVGVLRPRIVTPSNFAQVFTDREQAVVLAHETTHIDRQDVRANAFAALARCVCWFNPLVHVAAFLMRIDQELACDAQVVERHPKARRTYAQAMLKAELAGRPLPLGCCWPAGTEHPLTERIAMLKHDNPSRRRRLIGAVSIAALCALGGLAAWAAQPERIEYAPPEAPQVAPAQPARAAAAAPEALEAPQAVPVEQARAARQAEPARAEPAPAPQPAPRPAPIPQPAPRAAPAPEPARLETPQPTPTAQALPTQAPFPGWTTATSNDNWVPITISGTITDVKWVNPSMQIFVHGDDGRNWYLLSSTPNTVLRSGGSKATIRKDVRIVAQAQQDLDIACAPLCVAMAQAGNLTVNGTKLAGGPQRTVFEPEEPQKSPAPQAPASAPVKFPPSQPWQGVDKSAPVSIEGVITDAQWINPSVLIHITDKSGRKWLAATATPNGFLRSASPEQKPVLRTQMTAKGVRVTLQGFLSADRTCNPECGVFADPENMTFNGAKLGPMAPGLIQHINIEGLQRVSRPTVFSNISLRPGQSYDAGQVEASIKSLAATKLFSDVQIVRTGDDLTVKVVEAR